MAAFYSSHVRRRLGLAASLALIAAAISACSATPPASPSPRQEDATTAQRITQIVYDEDANAVGQQIVSVIGAWINAGTDDPRVSGATHQIATMQSENADKPTGGPGSNDEFANSAHQLGIAAKVGLTIASDNQSKYAPMLYGDEWATVVARMGDAASNDSDPSLDDAGASPESGAISAFNLASLVNYIANLSAQTSVPPVGVTLSGDVTFRQGSTSVGTGPGAYEYSIPVTISTWDNESKAVSPSDAVVLFDGNLGIPPEGGNDELTPIHPGDRLVATSPIRITFAEDGTQNGDQ